MPKVVNGLANVTQISAGDSHTCATLVGGGVSCWGNNFFGELGNTTNVTTNDANPTPSSVVGLPAGAKARSSSAGGNYVCALLDSGEVACWGSNVYGEYGTGANNGTNTSHPAPSTVAGFAAGTSIQAISICELHSCALAKSDMVFCWGLNAQGQLGQTTNSGTTFPNPTPAKVTNLGPLLEIEGGIPFLVSVVPGRVYESREGLKTIDGLQQGTGMRAAGQVTEVIVGGRAGIPIDADAAVINVTAIKPVLPGFITLFPCGSPQPDASTLNCAAEQVIANGAIIKLGNAGKICVYTHRAMDLIVDVTGYIPS